MLKFSLKDRVLVKKVSKRCICRSNNLSALRSCMFWLVSFSTLLFEMPLTRCVFTGLGEQVDAGDHERPSRSRRRTSRRSTSGTSSWLLILLVGSFVQLSGMKLSSSCKRFFTFDSLLKNIEVTCNFTCLMIFIVSQTKLIE